MQPWPRGGYDYFLLLLCKSSIWFTEKHIFKIIIYFLNTSKCATNYVISFEVYDGFIGQKILKLWRQESRPFGQNPAQIQPKSQFLFHKNLPPRDFSIMTLYALTVLITFRNVLWPKVAGLYFQNWLLWANLAQIWSNLVHLKTCKGWHYVSGTLEVLMTLKNMLRLRLEVPRSP